MRHHAARDRARLGAVSDDEVRVTEYTTNVEVVNLDVAWLPVAYPAVERRRARRALGGGAVQPHGRRERRRTRADLRGRDATCRGRRSSRCARARRRAPRSATGPRQPARRHPADHRRARREVTAGATTDYDALVALQRWFRGGEFKYSLDAPVEEGFDGSGAEAVAEFLEVREGYCVHFASAFALMARTLDMPVAHRRRIPARHATSEIIDGQTVYSVTARSCTPGPRCTSRASAGSPFEPTSGLGVPTTFSPRGTPGRRDRGGREPRADAAPTRAGAHSIRIDPDEPGETDAGGSRARGGRVDPLPVLAALLGDPARCSRSRVFSRAAPAAAVAAARGGDAGRGLADRAGGRDRPGHRGAGERDAARARAPAGRASTAHRRCEMKHSSRDRAGELRARRQARVRGWATRSRMPRSPSAPRCWRGDRRRAPARAARAALADHPPGQRLRRMVPVGTLAAAR